MKITLCGLLFLSLLCGPGWAQPAGRGPIYHEIPAGCELRPDSADSNEGPIYDSRGFYQGYYKPLAGSTGSTVPAPQKDGNSTHPTYYDKQTRPVVRRYPVYRKPVANPKLTNVGNSTYTGTPGYSPTIPYTNTGMPNAAGTPGYSPTLPYLKTDVPAAATKKTTTTTKVVKKKKNK